MKQNDKENYLEHLLKTEKYSPKNQEYLKQRVFITFNLLIKKFSGAGFREKKQLIDLGAADGTFVKIAQKYGLIAKGLDVSDGINFETDLLPFPNETIDYFTAISLIEHIQSPVHILREVFRALRSNGALIIVTPNWKYTYKEFYDDPTHLRAYTAKSLFFLLKSIGFSRVFIVPWLVCKPHWMWTMPFAFQIARLLPFRSSKTPLIPGFFKGKSKSILALAIK
jgi:2-polyprenyl-3-methyl-5-hydroxy-6-metoxy-1,4-benzoquinol methylase